MQENQTYKFIRGKYVLTMNSKDEFIEDGLVVIKGNKIEDVGPSKPLIEKYKDVDGEWLEYPKGVVMPGVVTAHTHLFQSLMKGIGCNLNLDDWVTKVIFPMGVVMGKKESYDAGRLNMVEMIRTGTTCFADSHYIIHDPENFDGLAKAVKETGIRGIICRASQSMKYHPDVPDEVIEDAETACIETEKCIKKYHNTLSGRLKVGVEPITAIDCSEEMIISLYELAEKYDTLFQMHVAETLGELTVVKNAKGMGIMEYLDSLGVLSNRTLLIHSVWISSKEKSLIAKRKANVSHNPLANMILGDGIAPVPDLLSLGVTVGIGVDGAASNNNQDMFESMKACVLLHRINTLDASVLNAYDALKMGTIEGAKAIGLDNEIGSLEVGKKADVIVVDANSIHMTPDVATIANIVFSGNGRDVDTAIIDGKVIMKNREFLNIDLEEVIEEANKSAAKMAREAKVFENIDKNMAKWSY
ncbi:amidohydrolase [Wukongibacter baidiensis]|uniref:amidohydrolase family protein n=1 Tax=Wukongibacter baidiensis TaxID=1723361 RepID=UPI003D7FED44